VLFEQWQAPPQFCPSQAVLGGIACDGRKGADGNQVWLASRGRAVRHRSKLKQSSAPPNRAKEAGSGVGFTVATSIRPPVTPSELENATSASDAKGFPLPSTRGVARLKVKDAAVNDDVSLKLTGPGTQPYWDGGSQTPVT